MTPYATAPATTHSDICDSEGKASKKEKPKKKQTKGKRKGKKKKRKQSVIPNDRRPKREIARGSKEGR
jgi:hypothetical protein